MRSIFFLITLLFACCPLLAQTDLQKLVNTEQAFATLAAERDTRTAFLANMTEDAVVFTPEKTLARPFWEPRNPNGSLLSWAPNFADISSNGILGYTSGNWEWRAKGKDDAPSAFGDFITLWLRQPNGRYKWTVDIGVDHAKPASYSTEWTTTKSDVGKAQVSPTSDFATGFYQRAEANGLAKAYEKFAGENIRSYREQKMPILGKKDVIQLLRSDKGGYSFAKRSTIFAAADLSYSLNSYTKTLDGKVVEKGNFLQIWKFYDGKWHIVLDVFKPVP